MILTNSRVTTYRACPRKHHISYDLGYRPIERTYPLRFGDVIHRSLEMWWLESGSERLESALKAVHAAIQAEEMDEFELVKAEEIIRGYHYRWIDVNDSSIRTIHVEHEFHLPLLSPTGGNSEFSLSGKMDGLADVLDRGTFVVEHKTSTEDISPGSSYWSALTLDTQISTYSRAAKQLNHPIVGTLYDVLARPTMKPAKETVNKKYRKDGELYANMRASDETPDEYRVRLRADIADHPDDYYQRGIVVRTERDEKEAAEDLWQTAQLIAYSVERGYHPRNSKSCRQYGSLCSYYGVCTGVESLEDPLKFRVSEVVNEELKGTSNDQEINFKKTA